MTKRRHPRDKVFGVDLGGTKLSAALADRTGRILAEWTQPTDRRGGRFVIRQIAATARLLANKTGCSPDSIGYAVIGSPGALDEASGCVRLAPNIPRFDRFDVPAALRAALGCDVAVENDVNLAAFGEWRQPSRRHLSDLAFVALGTGIGLGVISGGRLVRGARGAAGEIAYLPLGGDPFARKNRRRGTLETALGGRALAARYAASSGGRSYDARALFDRLADGDPIAAGIVNDAARLLATTILAIQAMLDPQRVVLGGGIGQRAELIAPTQRLLKKLMADPPKLEESLLGPRAGLIGALALASDHLRKGIHS